MVALLVGSKHRDVSDAKMITSERGSISVAIEQKSSALRRLLLVKAEPAVLRSTERAGLSQAMKHCSFERLQPEAVHLIYM